MFKIVSFALFFCRKNFGVVNYISSTDNIVLQIAYAIHDTVFII